MIVIPRHHEFLERYPSFAELADAPVAEVKQTWYPLGYNIRPERLHSIAWKQSPAMVGNCRVMRMNSLSLKGLTIHRRRNPLLRVQRGRADSIPT